MDTPVRMDGVRQLLLSLRRGEVTLSNSGGTHIEGVVSSTAEPRIAPHGALLKIADPGSRETTIRLAVPAGIDVRLRAGHCDITIRVPVGNGSIGLGGGSVRLTESAGSIDIASRSADVDIAGVGASARLRSGSGDITVGRADGILDIRAGSGDVTVASNHGEVTAHAGAGDVAVGVPEGVSTWLDLRTATGEVTVALPEGRRPDADAAVVRVSSGSGDIRIAQA